MKTARLFPHIDYAAHPAFPEDVGPQPEASAAVDVEIAAIDALLDPIRRGAMPMPEGAARRALESTVDDHLARIEATARASAGEHPVMAAALAKAIEFTRAELFEEASFSNARVRELATHGTHAARVASVIEERGAYCCRMDPARRARIASMLEGLCEDARAESRRKPTERVQVHIPREGPLWDEIRTVIEDAGLREGLASYGGHELECHYCVLELSHPDQTWWQGAFADAGVPTSPAAYFNNDHSFNVFKAMLYVNDVTERNGPFEFLPGSHRWQRSTTEALLVKSMDRGNAATWGAQGSPRAYYRPHFESAEFRATFPRLPRALAQTSHFGDDVVAGTELAEQIDRERFTCLSADADCIAFDGNALVHRGGLVAEGERWAIQLGFREPQSVATPRPARKSRGFLRRVETYVRHNVRDRLRGGTASGASAAMPKPHP